MSEPIIASSSRSSEDGAPTPIHCLYESELAAFVEARPSFVKGFVALEDFKAKAGQVLVLADAARGRGPRAAGPGPEG
jgi:leucyl aminopeptidase